MRTSPPIGAATGSPARSLVLRQNGCDQNGCIGSVGRSALRVESGAFRDGGGFGRCRFAANGRIIARAEHAGRG
jgi:hypothetical protein